VEWIGRSDRYRLQMMCLVEAQHTAQANFDIGGLDSRPSRLLPPCLASSPRLGSKRQGPRALSVRNATTATSAFGRYRVIDRDHRLHAVGCSDEIKFVKFCTERNRSLPLPDLVLSALQVNLARGRLPAPEAEGRRYLRIPLNAFPHASWGG
jgi:hypothetical protein